MAAKRTMLGQLASVGEGAIGRLAQNPVAHKAVEGVAQARDRVERLVNGFEALEQRLIAVEKRLETLEKAKTTTARKPASTKPSAAKKT